jgi:hypothetical protein
LKEERQHKVDEVMRETVVNKVQFNGQSNKSRFKLDHRLVLSSVVRGTRTTTGYCSIGKVHK